MAGEVVEVRLPNDVTALVRVAEADDEGLGGAEKAGWADTFDLEHVSGMLEGIAQAVRAGLVTVRPTRTMVELGIDLAVRNGHLTGLLVNGQANASLHVTLEWGGDRAAADAR